MQQGQITVFLSLILGLFLSVICTVVEAVRIEGLVLQGETAMQMAESSLLSGFQPELLSQYELFFLDGADEEGNFSTSRLESFVGEDLSYNLRPGKGLKLETGMSFFNSTLSSVELGNFCLATDAKGYEFYKQAIEYEENRLGIDFFEKLAEQTVLGEDSMMEGKGLSEEEQSQQDTIDRLEEESKDTEQSFSQKDFSKDNPLGDMEDSKASGILSLIMGDKAISGKQIDLEKLPSKRELLTGSGKKKTDIFYGTVMDRLLFGEYILEKFHHALSEEKGPGLSYEVEYLLIGKNSDKKNLEGVLNELLLFREGVNYLYLHSDKGKVAEAEVLATAIVGFTGIPPVVTAMRELLLLGWAYAESIMDLRSLMEGGTLALVKTSDNWQISLENIGNLSKEKSAKREEKGGLSYEGYLRLLLGMKNGTAKIMGALDLIETNLRQQEGLEGFRIDCCFYKCSCKMTYETKPLLLGIPMAHGMIRNGNGGYCFTREGTIGY